MEKKIYIVDALHADYDEQEQGLPCDLSDEEFKKEAEYQENVYSFARFEHAFNFEGVINPENKYIRIL